MCSCFHGSIIIVVIFCNSFFLLSQALIFHFSITQIKDGFAEGKDMVVSVMSAMGEEQICALKDIGPK